MTAARRLHPLALVVAGFVLLAAVPLRAEMPVVGALRRAAEAMARAGMAHDDPDLLAAAVAVLLQTGATLALDDPWNAALYLAHLQRLDAGRGDFARDIARLSAAGRGVVSGPNRHDMVLPAGASERFRMVMAGGEIAIVEARLKNGAIGGDIDLSAVDAAGRALAADRGPQTGIPGIGTYLEWLPDTCTAVDVIVRNVSNETLNVVLLAPPARIGGCDG